MTFWLILVLQGAGVGGGQAAVPAAGERPRRNERYRGATRHDRLLKQWP